MQWSHLKHQAEAFLAASLRDRVAYYAARYRHSHDQEGRCWITLDGTELVDMSTLRAWANQHHRTAVAHGLPKDAAWHHWEALVDHPTYWSDWRAGEEARKAAGYFTEWDFRIALEEYLQLALDDALRSADSLHRALALVDRRLGQRRFVRIVAAEIVHPLVRVMYQVRAGAEGWPVPALAEV